MIQTFFSLILLLGCLSSCANRTNNDKDAVKVSYVHRYGVEVANAEEFEELGSSGKIVKQLKNGKTSTTSYKDGKLHGLVTMSYPFTSICQEEALYNDGECVYKQTNYASGVPERKEQYAPDSVMMVSAWYEDGILRVKEEYQNNTLRNGEYYTNEQEEEARVTDGKGERFIRDGHGSLLSRQVIADGCVISETKLYPNGMPQAVLPYVRNKVEGTVKTYQVTGEPKTLEEFQDGERNGDMTVFVNGEVVSVIPYIDGKREGIQENYRPGTKEVVETISYKHDRRHGPTYRFIDDQKIIEWYFNGEKVSKMQFVELEANAGLPKAS
jgi:antitoxin component YwqK of YwqJK toxin-antitoxin module